MEAIPFPVLSSSLEFANLIGDRSRQPLFHIMEEGKNDFQDETKTLKGAKRYE
jgi:hypothetical protein